MLSSLERKKVGQGGSNEETSVKRVSERDVEDLVGEKEGSERNI